ncbi:HNH endonuclease [Enterococcus crotali]|uniref:HNH endonuclease n=1 Tax=Enterococcus crotali TaxID=1453587 RepID=UPI00046ED484|nr:HNH endonuclease [Enterococcus crotali]
MDYHRFKLPKAYCPKCSRKVELLFSEETSDQAQFYICFKCKTIGQFGVGELPQNDFSSFSETRKKKIQQAVETIPDKYIYKAKGSQLRLEEKTETYTRRWLSLYEYEKAFGEELGFETIDFRKDKRLCKWCNQKLEGRRRSFCSDRCSRNYGKATFFKRGISTLPYRIASRDQFYCRVTGADLARTNRFGVRIPASDHQVEIHHLIFVSAGGSDHESNLVTVSKQVHKDYHMGIEYAVEAIEKIKEQQLVLYRDKMYTK